MHLSELRKQSGKAGQIPAVGRSGEDKTVWTVKKKKGRGGNTQYKKSVSNILFLFDLSSKICSHMLLCRPFLFRFLSV